MEVPLTSEVLEQHGRFVRALAGALIRDPGRADDVAQEALTRWAFSPPLDASNTRGWLATVVRRLASNAKRAVERRARHEQRAAMPEATRSSQEESEQAELVQEVVAAVMALETEQRDTILARFFRGLSTAELARESGTSESTLRARERRALENLRRRLDRGHSSREAWMLGLTRLVPRRRPPVMPVSRKVLVVGGVAATAAVMLLARVALVHEPVSAPPSVPALGAPSVVASGPATSPGRTSGTVGSPFGGSGRVEAEPAEPTSSSRPDSGGHAAFQSSDGAAVRGKLRLSDGSPAAGIPWQWRGSLVRDLLHQGSDAPPDPIDLAGTTAADGSFAVEFLPPQDLRFAFRFTLAAKAPQHAEASWRWDEIPCGAVIDLGTVDLERGATVEGHLLDASGTPILGQDWELHCRSKGVVANGREPVSVRARVDPVTGVFRLEDVLPGLNQLEAYSAMAGWVQGPRVTAVAGAMLTADVVYSGPDSATRITVSTFSRPPYALHVPTEHIHLVTPVGERRTARVMDGSLNRSFDGLVPGLYTVEIDDPRFQPWSQGGIAPGTPVSAGLEPSAALRLAVTGLDGLPADVYAVRVELEGVDFFPREIRVSDGSVPLPGGIVRVPPGDIILHLEAGASATSVEVRGIAAGETRVVSVSLAENRAVSGVVVDASGRPRAGVEVLLLEPAQTDDSDASPILGPGTWTNSPGEFRRQLGATTSDVEGAFRLPFVTGGSFLVRAGSVGSPRAFSPVLQLSTGASAAGLRLELPAGASISGTVRGPDGAPCTGMRLWIGATSENPLSDDPRRPLIESVALDTGGCFAIDELVSGTLSALLFLPLRSDPNPDLRSAVGGWDCLELGALTVAPGESLARDFDAAVLPGMLVLEVVVDDEPAQGVEVWLSRDAEGSSEHELLADPHGDFAPIRLFPGAWKVQARDPEQGWSSASVPVQVSSGGHAEVILPVALVTGTVRVVDANGRPYPGRRVRVLPAGYSGVVSGPARHVTDADGRVALALTAGRYDFALEDAHPLAGAGPSASVLWTAQGPEVGEVRL